MSFDLFALETQIIARLALVAGTIPIKGSFDVVDLTDTVVLPVAAQIVFMEFLPDEQVGRGARHHAAWSFDLYVDTGRATSTHKTNAATLFSNALAQLIGWEILPPRELQVAPSQKSGFDGRIVRISFGFKLATYLAA
jgi:hypothetical protein